MNQNNNVNESIQNQQQNLNNNNNKNKIIIIIVIIVVLVILGLISFVNYNNKNKQSNENINENENKNKEKETTDFENADTEFSGILDSNVNTTYDESGAFLMNVEDVFTLAGKGTVINGTILRGKVKIGDKVQLIGLDKKIVTLEVINIEMLRENITEAKIGDNVGILVSDISRQEVFKGQVLAQPNSIIASKKIEAEVYIPTKEEVGYEISFASNYSAQLYIRNISIQSVINLLNDEDTASSGNNVKMNIALNNAVAVEIGQEFEIKQDEKIIGKGKIISID